MVMRARTLHSFVGELQKLSGFHGGLEVYGPGGGFKRVQTTGKGHRPGTLEKISARITPQAAAKAKAHFEAQDKDWKAFEKHLRSPSFRSAISRAEQADPVLKKYVKTFGEYQGSKNVVAEIKSKDSGRTYTIKDIGSRWGCNCGDWQFKHSINGGDCKHIKSVKKSGLVKESSVLKAMSMGALSTNKVMQQKDKGRAAKQMVEQVHASTGYRPPPRVGLITGHHGSFL